MDKKLLNIKEICEYLGIGETKARELVRGHKVFAWSNTDYRQLKHEIQSKGITNPEILEFVNQDRWIEKTRI